jgi:cupin 2 domain-containing protein
LPRDRADEEFCTLLTRPGLRIERIVSTGQVSADWYDQDQDEWVLLVEGGAHLLVEGEGEIVLGPGDHLMIAAHVRHRVTWTDPERPTIWLAVHFDVAEVNNG